VEKTIEWVMSSLGFVFAVIERNANWLAPVTGFVAFIVLTILFGLAVRWTVYKSISLYLYLKSKIIQAFNAFGNMIESIESRTVRLVVKIMAKIKKHVVADIVFDALFEAYCQNKLTRSEWKRYNDLIGKFCGLDDLVLYKRHKNAIRNALKKRKLAGPNKKSSKGDENPFKAAGGPPALHVPPVEKIEDTNIVSSSKFLQKLKERNAA